MDTQQVTPSRNDSTREIPATPYTPIASDLEKYLKENHWPQHLQELFSVYGCSSFSKLIDNYGPIDTTAGWVAGSGQGEANRLNLQEFCKVFNIVDVGMMNRAKRLLLEATRRTVSSCKFAWLEGFVVFVVSAFSPHYNM